MSWSGEALDLRTGPRGGTTFHVWNRRLHAYFGLYFLCFLWLFAWSGWLLNHGRFALAVGANERTETVSERSISPPAGDDDLTRARDVMRQLGLSGEIGWPGSPDSGVLAFDVTRPAEATQVRVDLSTNVASVRHFGNSGAAAFRLLHTFSGSTLSNPAARDWWLTVVWVAAMDALAGGLVVMVLGGYVLWWRRAPRRRVGALVLAAGFICCGVFLGTF